MKLLLDENLPEKLKLHFPLHEVFTVRDLTWNGIKNGALLALMLQNGFEALLSFDQNIPHQQNFTTYPITVFVFIAPANTYPVLEPLCTKVNEFLSGEEVKKEVIYIQA